MLSATILCSLSALSCAAPQAPQASTPPPGMVAIPGGKTKVGSTQKDIEKLLETFPTLRTSFAPLAGETPQTSVDVPDF